jgi:hypothetical protein
LGIRITSPTDGETIRTYDNGGVYEIKGKFLNAPGPDIFAITNIGGQWWKVGALNRKRQDDIRKSVNGLGPKESEEILAKLGPLYPGIEMARLPKGLELQDKVSVVVETPPAK